MRLDESAGRRATVRQRSADGAVHAAFSSRAIVVAEMGYGRARSVREQQSLQPDLCAACASVRPARSGVLCAVREVPQAAAYAYRPWQRSEEHTSELQSLMRISYAVFCLKKKNKIY